MRQFLIALSLLVATTSASAFHDSATITVTEKLMLHIEKMEDSQLRLKALEKYKDFLFERLNSIELPDNFMALSNDNPVIEEYRSLTEFDNYINLIRMKEVTAKDCQRTKMRIEASTSREGGMVPEAEVALKVLSALCR